MKKRLIAAIAAIFIVVGLLLFPEVKKTLTKRKALKKQDKFRESEGQ